MGYFTIALVLVGAQWRIFGKKLEKNDDFWGDCELLQAGGQHKLISGLH
jgi:hypothetical protein